MEPEDAIDKRSSHALSIEDVKGLIYSGYDDKME